MENRHTQRDVHQWPAELDQLDWQAEPPDERTPGLIGRHRLLAVVAAAVTAVGATHLPAIAEEHGYTIAYGSYVPDLGTSSAGIIHQAYDTARDKLTGHSSAPRTDSRPTPSGQSTSRGIAAPESRQAAPSPNSDSDSTISTTLNVAALQRVTRLKIFFGHQSVGANILEGIPSVYAAYGVNPPTIVSTSDALHATSGYIAEKSVGENGHPSTKERDFVDTLRGGLGGKVGVAILKLCFVDVVASSDVEQIGTDYDKAMAQAQSDNPNVVFLFATDPLTTGDSADNATRQRYNEHIRARYGRTGRLFDIAKAESTTPDGTRVNSDVNGTAIEALYDGYSSDGGHLNAAGEKAIANAFLLAIANATASRR